MLVHVDIAIEDIESLGRTASKRARRFPTAAANPWRRRLALGAVWVVSSIFTALGLHYGGMEWNTNLAFSLFLAAVFCGAFVYFLIEERRKLYPNEDGFMLGSKSYEIDESGVTETWQHGHSVFRWASICGVEDTPSHLFLFVDRCVALTFPKRCFDSDQQITDFMGIVDRLSKTTD